MAQVEEEADGEEERDSVESAADVCDSEEGGGGEAKQEEIAATGQPKSD